MGAAQSLTPGEQSVNLIDVQRKLELFNNILEKTYSSNKLDVHSMLDNLLQSNTSVLGLEENTIMSIKSHHEQLKETLEGLDSMYLDQIEANIKDDGIRNEVSGLADHVRKLHNNSAHFEKKYIELNIIVLFIIKQVMLISQNSFGSVVGLMEKQNIAIAKLMRDLREAYPEIEDRLPDSMALIKQIHKMSEKIQGKMRDTEANLSSVTNIATNTNFSSDFPSSPPPSTFDNSWRTPLGNFDDSFSSKIKTNGKETIIPTRGGFIRGSIRSHRGGMLRSSSRQNQNGGYIRSGSRSS